jgi:uncharacterized membrane protein YkgB
MVQKFLPNRRKWFDYEEDRVSLPFFVGEAPLFSFSMSNLRYLRFFILHEGDEKNDNKKRAIKKTHYGGG